MSLGRNPMKDDALGGIPCKEDFCGTKFRGNNSVRGTLNADFRLG